MMYHLSMSPSFSIEHAARSSPVENVHSKFFQGLADATRLKIVRILLGGPRGVGELVTQLGVSQSGVSNHLACLKWCGYVGSRRHGRSIVYHISDKRVRVLLEMAETIVADNAERLASCSRIERRGSSYRGKQK